MRTLPARVGAAPFFNQRSEDLSEVQEPILGSTKSLSPAYISYRVNGLVHPDIRKAT